MRIARFAAAAVAATLVAITSGSPALAHNSLVKAAPAKNATVTKAPATVELTFLQSVDPATLRIAVADAQKKDVAAGATKAAGKKGVLPLNGTLANGRYTVTYDVVSRDGHQVRGTYDFTVDAPVAATPAPAAPSSSSAEPAPAVTSVAPAAPPATVTAAETSGDGSGTGLIIAIIAGVLVLAAGAFLLLRNRKTP